MNDAAEKKMTLVDIVAAYREALWTADELEGEILPGIEETLDELEEEMAAKIDRCLLLALEFEAKAAAHKERAKLQADTARVLTNQATRLREYVRSSLVGADIKKIETENFPKVRLQRTAPSVVILDEARFWEHATGSIVRLKKEPDKKAIKLVLEAGVDVPGAAMSEPGTSLRWK